MSYLNGFLIHYHANTWTLQFTLAKLQAILYTSEVLDGFVKEVLWDVVASGAKIVEERGPFFRALRIEMKIFGSREHKIRFSMLCHVDT